MVCLPVETGVRLLAGKTLDGEATTVASDARSGLCDYVERAAWLFVFRQRWH
jgi:hypothetical protein